MDIFLYNTLSRQKEKFIPIRTNEVGMYTCGPTVYNFAHIGNLRTYIFEDLLKRALKYNGYTVKQVMNITDVGHLTDDADDGEDKMEKGSLREGKSAWDIAEYYTKSFQNDLKSLNIIAPSIWCRATDNIPEQIALIKVLEDKGFAYKTPDGIYFDTSKFPDYNKLSHLQLDELKEGARVEKNDFKKNLTDFALWKFSPIGEQRQMEWESPWGKGFPGWHIECSAMSMKFLGEQLDIHCGGIDHINVHHTNEIAQSEAATGKKFFNYWMHGAFLNIAGGKKMAKSEGNFLTVKNSLLDKKINPLAYRYACLQVHYRKPMEYNDEILPQAEHGLDSLYAKISALKAQVDSEGNNISQGKILDPWKEKFMVALNDDLNVSQALAIMFDVLKSDNPAVDRLATAFDFDKVFGLNLSAAKIAGETEIDLAHAPENIKNLINERSEARKNKDWAKSDSLRVEIEAAGYKIKDDPGGKQIISKV